MKKLIAILLVLLLTASLFAGCKDEKAPETTPATEKRSDASTEAPVGSSEAPVGSTEAPVGSTEAPDDSTEPPVPVDVDGVQLLREAGEKMAALQSLRFRMELDETITSEGFSLGVTIKGEGAVTKDPQATYSKGAASLFGMEIPMEEYAFVEGDTLVSYSWDDDEQCFLRSESPLEETDPDAEAAEPDYENLELSTALAGNEYVVTVNATLEQFNPLFALAASFLSGTDAASMLPDLSDTEGLEELQNVKFPVIFRIDRSSGQLTGFVFDMDALFDALMSAVPEGTEMDGQISGSLELHYYDYDAVEPIVPPENFKESSSTDWEDWDEDEDETGEDAEADTEEN